MDKGREQASRNANHASAGEKYVKFEKQLVLLAWLNRLFGYESNKNMLEYCKDVARGLPRTATATSTTACWPVS